MYLSCSLHDSQTKYAISSRDQRIMPVYLISRYGNCHIPTPIISYAPDETGHSNASTNRIADPLFALTMGVSAALTRIRRDQREKYPEKASKISYGTIVQTSGQRLRRWWNGDFQDV
jgi:hypothetical protein